MAPPAGRADVGSGRVLTTPTIWTAASMSLSNVAGAMSKPGTRLVGTPLTLPSRPVLGTLVGTATGMGTGRFEIAAAAELASGAGTKGENVDGRGEKVCWIGKSEDWVDRNRDKRGEIHCCWCLFFDLNFVVLRIR